MAKLTTSELANELGVKRQTIGNYIKRGKFKKNRQGLIDTESAQFKMWYELYRLNKNKREKKQASETLDYTEEAETVFELETEVEHHPKPIKSKTKTTGDPEVDEVIRFEKAKKQAAAEKMEIEMETSRMKLMKQQARLVPRDQVERLFAVHFNSISSRTHDFIQNELKHYCTISGMKRDIILELQKNITENFAKMVSQSKKDTAKTIKEDAEYYQKQVRM